MSKIDEMKEKLANRHSKFEGKYIETSEGKISIVALTASCFKAGFDAAMDLQLPVLFIKWIKKESWEYSDNGVWFKQHEPFGINFSHKTDEELYDYWLENIYQPNQGTEDERSVANEEPHS